MAFWGSITVDGVSVPVGTVVRAYYGTSLAGQVVIQESGIYGYAEATRQKLLVAEGVGQITFKFQHGSLNGGNETDGTTLQSYFAFESGATKNINLAFTLPPAPVTPFVLGGSSGGGGGGAPAPVNPAPTSTLSFVTKKGDTNGDGRTDIFDFNFLMIQWGRSGQSLSSDFNGDGKVDIFDFNTLMINWSK